MSHRPRSWGASRSDVPQDGAGAVSAQAPRLTIRQVHKSFGAVEVLRGIDLTVGPGEFIGLVGPNGAGKSTLMKTLAGLYAPTLGEISIDGTVARSLRDIPSVAFIHQDLGLVDALPIVDNLRLGERPLRLAGTLLSRRAEREAARRALDRVGLAHDVETPVGGLAPGEKTLIAVARAIDRGASLLFVDEVTSMLPPPDARKVLDALSRQVELGGTVILVSHKLGEILQATRRVVIMLDGRIAADEETAELDRERLVNLLLQHERGPGGVVPPADGRGAPLLELRSAVGGRVGPVDLTVHAGEVVGLTGLPGSGLHDLALLAYGAIRPVAGEVVMHDNVPRALVPPHRETQGGFAELDVADNMTVSALRRWRVAHTLFNAGRARRDASGVARTMDVRPSDSGTPFGDLSGGNKQKVIFGRMLLREARVCVLCEPTRGVDAQSRSEIYRLIERMRDEGRAVLITTSDAEDLFAVCTRIGVVDAGRLGEIAPVDAMTQDNLEALL